MIGKYAYNENTEKLVGKITGEEGDYWLTINSENDLKRIPKEITVVQDSIGPMIPPPPDKYATYVPETPVKEVSPGDWPCPHCQALNAQDAESCAICDTNFAYLRAPGYKPVVQNNANFDTGSGSESELAIPEKKEADTNSSRPPYAYGPLLAFIGFFLLGLILNANTQGRPTFPMFKIYFLLLGISFVNSIRCIKHKQNRPLNIVILILSSLVILLNLALLGAN